MILGKKRRAVGFALPALWVLGVLAWESCVPLRTHVPPLLAVAPALACAATGRRRCVLVSGAFALLALYPLSDGVARGGEMAERLMVSGLATLCVVAAAYRTAGRRSRLQRDLARAREVATAAQEAVVRPPPRRLRRFSLAAGYLSATRGAAVGGDLYDVVDTSHGMRIVIGDVRGHGLAAIRTVAAALGTFREAAHDEPRLEGVLRRMERGFARHLDSDSEPAADGGAGGSGGGGGDGGDGGAGEEFLTLLLLDVREDGTVRALNCGHPWPFRLPGPDSTCAGAVPLTEAEPLPPLGLFPLPGLLPEPLRIRLAPGEGLFLCTDGAADARDTRRTFFPLETVLGKAAAQTGPEARVAAVRDALLRHTRGRLADDVALLSLRREPCREPLSSDIGSGHVRDAGVPG